MPALIAMGVGVGLQATDALIRRSKAKKGLRAMEGKMPQYRSPEDIQTQAETSIRTGYTPEERAAFMQSAARQNLAGYRQATQTNPNLAGAVQAGINYGNAGVLADFAAKEAQMRRQRIGQFAQALTQADVRKTGEERGMFREAAQNYGLAQQQASADIMNALQQGVYMAGTTLQKPTPTPTTTPSPGFLTGQTGTNQFGTYINTDLQSPYQGNYYQPYGQLTPSPFTGPPLR